MAIYIFSNVDADNGEEEEDSDGFGCCDNNNSDEAEQWWQWRYLSFTNEVQQN